jgi:hypothetical protein
MFLAKVIDLVIDIVLKFFIYIVKIISPIKISPKEINRREVSDNWNSIYNIKINNRLNSELYDIYVVGSSKEDFSIKIISDDSAKSKTVEYMNINTNHLVVVAKDEQTGNHLWIFRIHKFGPKEVLNLNLKIENKERVYFKILQYSSTEIPIRERKDGVVAIPFKIKKMPNIK